MVVKRPYLSMNELNRQRRAAVQLRLEEKTLGYISKSVGLSAPTIISAYKAYLAGGWSAVDTKPRGRPPLVKKALTSESEIILLNALFPKSAESSARVWDIDSLVSWIAKHSNEETNASKPNRKTVTRFMAKHGLLSDSLLDSARSHRGAIIQRWFAHEYQEIQKLAKRKAASLLWIDERRFQQKDTSFFQLFAHTPRGTQYWMTLPKWPTGATWVAFLEQLSKTSTNNVIFITHNIALKNNDHVSNWLKQNQERVTLQTLPAEWNTHPICSEEINHHPSNSLLHTRQYMSLTHLQQLEAESIHIMREVVAEADNPVMLYSIGKDSAVMLHLARKAFFPAPPPFPLLHVDTRWKFKAMYELRDRMAKESGMELLIHVNPDGVAKNINPFTHGSAIHTDVMKTEGLKQALDKHGFDAAFGGARRDEEKSRAKERIFSFRSEQHRWDPKNQRPELWRLYNTKKHKGESIRVFPISNWTELDIWQYIHLENIPIVPLYYSAVRPVVERNGTLIMVDDDRMPLRPGEVPMMKSVRFRTLGCYPLTGAVESTADTLPAIIQEMLLTTTSERQGRMIDHDTAASMEKKKQEGYF